MRSAIWTAPRDWSTTISNEIESHSASFSYAAQIDLQFLVDVQTLRHSPRRHAPIRQQLLDAVRASCRHDQTRSVAEVDHAKLRYKSVPMLLWLIVLPIFAALPLVIGLSIVFGGNHWAARRIKPASVIWPSTSFVKTLASSSSPPCNEFLSRSGLWAIQSFVLTQLLERLFFSVHREVTSPKHLGEPAIKRLNSPPSGFGQRVARQIVPCQCNRHRVGDVGGFGNRGERELQLHRQLHL